MNKLCESIDTLSMAYLDDELADEELREFELHAIECAECRAHVEAERAALADLRRQLTPPPTPDLVRARMMAALDGEDAEASRHERRSRLAQWALPGFASAAAVAALALFVFARGPGPAPEPVAVSAVNQQLRSPSVATMRPRVPGAVLPSVAGVSDTASKVTIERVAAWKDELNGREVAMQLYAVQAPGGEATIQASVFDSNGWDLEIGERVSAGGLDLWVALLPDGRSAVVHETADRVGYVFSSAELAPRDLVTLVVSGQLIDRVGAPRR